MVMVKVAEKNWAKIVQMLDDVNGTAVQHTYRTYEQIERIVKHNEKKLEELHIPKKSRVGASEHSVSGGNVPNAYRYSRKATYVELHRRPTGWFLGEVLGARIWRDAGPDKLILEQSQMDAFVEATKRSHNLIVVEDK